MCDISAPTAMKAAQTGEQKKASADYDALHARGESNSPTD